MQIMGTLNNNSGSQQRHDGQQNYQHSNQRNPDHNRSDTHKHQYKDREELTNDANFESGEPINGDMDFNDTQQNVDKNNHSE